VIPAEALAKISFRLVVGQKSRRRYGRPSAITSHPRGFPGDCKVEFGDFSIGPRKFALPWDMKALAAAKKALTEEWGKETVLFGSGASIPVVSDFQEDARPRLAPGRLRPRRTTTSIPRTRNTTLKSYHKGHPFLGAHSWPSSPNCRGDARSLESKNAARDWAAFDFEVQRSLEAILAGKIMKSSIATDVRLDRRARGRARSRAPGIDSRLEMLRPRMS